MARVQTDIYSTSIQAAEPTNARSFTLGPSIVIPGGDGVVVQFPARYEGKAMGLTVKQTAGVNAAFKVELLDSQIPYPGPYVGNPAINAFVLPGTPTVPVELFRVIESGLSGSSGVVLEWRDDYGRPYINLDRVGANQVDFLYLVILPTGAGGATTWDVMLTTYRDIV